jgi:hypothetical protein
VKYRGSTHGTNEYPFIIDKDGISVIPVTSLRLNYKSRKILSQLEFRHWTIFFRRGNLQDKHDTGYRHGRNCKNHSRCIICGIRVQAQ